jgi:hypothetical protein
LNSKTCIKARDAINKKGLEESYMVTYRVARTGKPHITVEDFILPAAADLSGTTLGEKAKNKLYRQRLHQTLFHEASVTWQEMF